MEIVLVDQGDIPVEIPPGLVDRVVRLPVNRGFTGGTNAGIAIGTGARDFLATVNDDLLVEPGWTAALVAALDREPRAAAAQGVNLQLDRPTVADGWGIAWNRAYQAVQLGHGLSALVPDQPTREVFGVSATAALYRLAALTAVTLLDGQVFDERLGSYYEDADLADRLRAAGWTALCVPAARARHAGSASSTASQLSRRRWSSLYGNRYLVAARLLGSGFWPRLPLLIFRDVKDLIRALLSGEWAQAGGIGAGWARALRHLPAYVRRGPAIPHA
jgi:N-acetylglucosaminyl-diphospho-decaprenol L-rhamnosyltransferase